MTNTKVTETLDRLVSKNPHMKKCERWGHVYYTENGKEYRLKAQTHTIRHEVKVAHGATQYSKASTQWVRIKTYRPKNRG